MKGSTAPGEKSRSVNRLRSLRGLLGRGWRAVRLRTPRENAAQRRRFPQQSQRVSVYGRELAS